MLIEFSDGNGTPVYINPQYVIAVREEKHFGRPGVGAGSEYRDTLILTTRYRVQRAGSSRRCCTRAQPRVTGDADRTRVGGRRR